MPNLLNVLDGLIGYLLPLLIRHMEHCIQPITKNNANANYAMKSAVKPLSCFQD